MHYNLQYMPASFFYRGILMAESWSFQFDGDQPERLYRDGCTQFDDGPFRGWMEGVEMRRGFHLYRITGRSSHRYSLVPKGVMERGSIVLGTMLGGAGRVTTEGAQEQSWRDERRFFAVTPEAQIGYHIEPGRKWSVAGLVLTPEALAELAGDDELPALARETLDGKLGPYSLMRPLADATMARLARDLFDLSYTGSMASLHRQACCLHFLAGLLERLGAEDNSSEISARDKVRVREARERLVSDLRDPPDLHELAHSVGLSARRLNEGFRAVFGTTVFEHLRDTRLDAARIMLHEEAQVPLKQIAWRVGYAHSTNFISAYRRRFGTSPARHRRG
jgi:AraC-like DNA-binding protein